LSNAIPVLRERAPLRHFAAMTPGPDIILACPLCGALARYPTFEYAEDAPRISWTDGYHEVTGVPRSANIAHCQSCHNHFWTGAADQVGYIVPGEEPTEEKATFFAAPRIEPPGEEDYFEAIHGELAKTPEQELELRVHAWWRGNDRYRHSEEPHRYPDTPERLENLRRIVELTEDGQHEMALFRAEALRQLGRFEDSEEALDGLCSDYGFAREKLVELLREKSRDLDVLFS
jgi:hypothetical protein